MKAITAAGYKPGVDIGIALDAAASEFYKNGKYVLASEKKKLSADQIAGAAILASDDISPISDVRASGSYRRQMAEVLVRRALTSVWEELAEENADD